MRQTAPTVEPSSSPCGRPQFLPWYRNSFPIPPLESETSEVLMSSLFLFLPIAGLVAIYCMAIRHDRR